MKIRRGAIDLHITDTEGSGPPVVILHGLAGSSTEMAATAAALGDHRVVTVDARGHGRSTRFPDDVSRAAHVADVVFVIESVLGSPVSLVGQSLGGHTALLVASARPDLVERLVLLEAGVGGDGNEQSRDAMRRFFTSWPVPFGNKSHARAFLGDSPLSRAWIADLEVRPDGLWPRFDPDVMVETIAHVDAHPRWPEWCDLNIPTLAVFGTEGMFSAAAKDEFVSRGSKVTRVDLDGGSHDAHLDAFPQWIAELRAFLPPPRT
ncbi:pimeloyl-ACP methyl ester carboxylesterase [Cryobacterium sp. MP_3.1]|uniref:alpha/beta fold hydrolase n=1 Tax=Cryobacterium sp. MP_3.1 TaxID=3071711 RepID=UPI002DF8E2EA|nr:pimeloyl-ACP methyl ester carboxylesterase [Cryobacterium sp. MP_3.1]